MTWWKWAFWTRARLGRRRCRRSNTRKQMDFRKSCRRAWIIQEWFWLLLWHGPFYDMCTETKVNSGRRVMPYRNILWKLKHKSQTKLGCISIKLHQGCLPLLPPSTSFTSSTSATPETARLTPPLPVSTWRHKNEDVYNDSLTVNE